MDERDNYAENDLPPESQWVRVLFSLLLAFVLTVILSAGGFMFLVLLTHNRSD